MSALSRKNARRKKAQKAEKFRKALRMGIDTTPRNRRTLKRSARVELRAESARRNPIRPWIKEPSYGLKDEAPPPNSLLGLPTEIRQRILDLTISDASMAYEPASYVKRRVGVLNCVAPLIRMDMVYVGEQWRRQWRSHRKLAADRPNFNERLHDTLRKRGGVSGRWRLWSRKHGQVLEVRSRIRRTRAQKCFLCERRHWMTDPVCPPARADPALWRRMTKKVVVEDKGFMGKGKSKRKDEGADSYFPGLARTVFEHSDEEDEEDEDDDMDGHEDYDEDDEEQGEDQDEDRYEEMGGAA